MKNFYWFEILLVIVIATASLYAVFSDPQNMSYRWFIRDDAYYYFKVAQNISEGYGITFDGFSTTNGYHPLWLLICIPIFALARFDLILPLRILFLVMSGLSAATSILLFRMIRKTLHPAIGMIAAIYWSFNIGIIQRVYKQGLETGIAAFFVALFIYKLMDFEKKWRAHSLDMKQIMKLGLLGVLVMFSRLDLAFIAGMAGIWIVFRKYPIRYLLPLDIVFIFVSVLASVIYRVSYEQYFKYSDMAMTMIAVNIILKLLAAYVFGLYQKNIFSHTPTLIKKLSLYTISTSVLTGIAMILVSRIANFDGFPRSVIAYDAILTFLFFGLSRILIAFLTTGDRNDEPSPLQLFRSEWKNWLEEGTAYYGVVFGTLSLYMLWNKIAFDTFSPISGQIKRYWGSLAGRVYGGPAQTPLAFFGLEPAGDGNVWHPISTMLGQWTKTSYNAGFDNIWPYILALVLTVIAFSLLLFINKRKSKIALSHLFIVPLFSSAWLQVFSYHMTGYSAYKEWYWTGELILAVLLICIALEMIYETVRKYRTAQFLLWIITCGTMLAMTVNYFSFIQHTLPYGKFSKDVPYNDIAAFLEEHTEPGSIIGMTGGGNAAYFVADRTVVNMDGLINSAEYFELLKKREAGAYLAELGMDYILANPQLLDQLPYKRQFDAYLQFINTRYGGKELMVYSPTPE